MENLENLTNDELWEIVNIGLDAPDADVMSISDFQRGMDALKIIRQREKAKLD